MKAKKLDGVEVWKEFEDVATRLGLNVIERAVYSYLLLHTRLEGKLRLHFSLPGLACNVRISRGPVRDALHRLAGHGALRFIERSYSGHLVEIRLPAEVPAPCRKTDRKTQTSSQSKLPAEPNLEELDFLRSRALRQAIHVREGGKCFYCLRRIPLRSRCLDHVVPRAKSGKNSYRNLVSCCAACNWQKADLAAVHFLRQLYREGRLSTKDLRARLRAVQALAAGKLPPQVFSGENAGSEGGTRNKGAREGAARTGAEAQGLHRPVIL
jgi:5-methylcytosine-specific restriction endonuclease McrA